MTLVSLACCSFLVQLIVSAWTKDHDDVPDRKSMRDVIVHFSRAGSLTHALDYFSKCWPSGLIPAVGRYFTPTIQRSL